jgi:hypothetical protein
MNGYYDRSLAFSALLELTDWFGPMECSEGEREITRLLEDWNASGRLLGIWEFTKGREPSA